MSREKISRIGLIKIICPEESLKERCSAPCQRWRIASSEFSLVCFCKFLTQSIQWSEGERRKPGGTEWIGYASKMVVAETSSSVEAIKPKIERKFNNPTELKISN